MVSKTELLPGWYSKSRDSYHDNLDALSVSLCVLDFLFSWCPLSMSRFRRSRDNITETDRMHMSLIFELRATYLSFPKVLGLASASVLCAILDSTLGLEPAWSATTAKGPTSPNRPPLTQMSILMTSVLLVVSLVFSGVISKGWIGLFHGNSPKRLVPPLFLPSHQCYWQNVSWWLFCLRC